MEQEDNEQKNNVKDWDTLLALLGNL